MPHWPRFPRAVLALAFASALALAACARAGNQSALDSGRSAASHEQAATAHILPIEVRVSGFHMTPSTLTIPEGRPVQLVFVNDDSVTHQMTIPRLSAKVLGAAEVAQITGNATPSAISELLQKVPDGEVSFRATPGEKVTTTFIATKAGTFQLECTTPGHQEAGMIAKVFVTEASTGTTSAQTASAPAATSTATSGGHVMASTTAEGAAHQARDASLSPADTSSVKQITLTVSDTEVEIAPGVKLAAWTFDGQVPSPVIHVRQGDTVQFTLTNHSTMPHSIDFHAARTAPNVNYKNVAPGQSYTFTWKAKDPGVFMYHCGTAPILQHLAQGMYGAVIVDPADQPLPKVDREFVFVQSEFYLTDSKGLVTTNLQKANSGNADFVVFNGYANQYADHPIPVKVGEKIRVYLVNAGPNHFSAFHVVGTIFDHVWVDGNPQNDLHGIQTWTVAPGEGSAFDFTLSEEGTYPMVSHSFADANHGAVAVFKAEE